MPVLHGEAARIFYEACTSDGIYYGKFDTSFRDITGWWEDKEEGCYFAFSFGGREIFQEEFKSYKKVYKYVNKYN